MNSQTGVELHFYRYWSNQGNYLAITTSTTEPAVDEYMIFTLRLNFFTDEVNYLVNTNHKLRRQSSKSCSVQQKSKKAF